ncbi:MAG TPA: hypothetical protein VKC55_09635 [Actinomycetota bacterium]|nr:hypothetical protein [Actinomycetota bacterium]
MDRRASVAGVLALVGGLAAVVGSFLPWAEISAGPFTEQAKGIDGWEGKAAIVAGLVMFVAGARVMAGSHRAITRMRPGAAIGGLVAFGVGAYTALTARDQLLDAAQGQLPRAEVERALDSGLLQLSIAIGLVVVIAGGAQGIVATLLSIGVSEPAAPPSSGAGLRGWSSDPPDRAPSPPRADVPPAPPGETGPPG